MSQTIWFSADLHLDHSNIIKLCNRPFTDVSAMNEVIIENLNKCVRKHDKLFLLGDFAYGDFVKFRDFRRRINCNYIHFLMGNHDYKNVSRREAKLVFENVDDIHTFKHEKCKYILCHYCFRSWEGQHGFSYHLCGHNHHNLPCSRRDDFSGGLALDVGVDTNKMMPYNIDEVNSIMKWKLEKIRENKLEIGF